MKKIHVYFFQSENNNQWKSNEVVSLLYHTSDRNKIYLNLNKTNHQKRSSESSNIKNCDQKANSQNKQKNNY